MSIRTAVYHYCLMLCTTSVVIYVLSQTSLPTTQINWPQSLGWASMLIWPLIASIYHRDRNALLATVGCIAAYVAGYFLHYSAKSGAYVGYDMLSAVTLYLSLSAWCMLCNKKTMAILGLVMCAFGVLTMINVGRYVNSVDHFWYRVGWCVAYSIMLLPALQKKSGRKNDGEAQIAHSAENPRLRAAV